MDKDFLLCYIEDETIKQTWIRLHNSDALERIFFNKLQLHYNYITITLIVL